MEDVVILGAISGEAFHHIEACELRGLQQVLDLKMAICKAKGLQTSKMLRLFDQVGEEAVPLPDNLALEELWRRQRHLRALVVLPDGDVDRLPALLAPQIERRAKVICELPAEMQADRSLVLEAVTQNWKVLRFCKEFQDDFEIVRQAVLANCEALQFASPRLQRALALEAVRMNSSALRFLPELSDDLELFVEALKWNPFALRFASVALANRKDLVLPAVRSEGLALLYAGEAMRSDREVVLAAVRSHGSALLFAAGHLRNDREVVSEAVRQNGLALQHASEELQNDAELKAKAGVPCVSARAPRGDIFCSSPRPARNGYPWPS